MGNSSGKTSGPSSEPGTSNGQSNEVKNEDLLADQKGGLSKDQEESSWGTWWKRWRKQRRKINFVEPVRSENSILSTTSITMMDSDLKPLKSSLRGSTSTHSGSSVRFNLPEDNQGSDFKRKKITSAEIVPSSRGRRVEDNSGHFIRNEEFGNGIWGFFRRKSWRIALCLICGLVAPFFLVIPVLLTYETLRRVPSP